LAAARELCGMEHGNLAIRLARHPRPRQQMTASRPDLPANKSEGFDAMRDVNVIRRSGSLLRRTLWSLAGLCLLMAAGIAPVQAHGYDDAYRGPPPAGGLDAQMRSIDPGPSVAAPAVGVGAAPGGGLQGRQTQGTIDPIPIAIPEFL